MGARRVQIIHPRLNGIQCMSNCFAVSEGRFTRPALQRLTRVPDAEESRKNHYNSVKILEQRLLMQNAKQ